MPYFLYHYFSHPIGSFCLGFTTVGAQGLFPDLCLVECLVIGQLVLIIWDLCHSFEMCLYSWVTFKKSAKIMSQILLCYIPLFLICLRVRRPRFFQDPNTVSTGYFFKHFFGFCFFFLGGESCHSGVSTSSTVRNHSCWLRGPFGSICPGLAACKVNALPLCSLQPMQGIKTGCVLKVISYTREWT